MLKIFYILNSSPQCFNLGKNVFKTRPMNAVIVFRNVMVLAEKGSGLRLTLTKGKSFSKTKVINDKIFQILEV